MSTGEQSAQESGADQVVLWTPATRKKLRHRVGDTLLKKAKKGLGAMWKAYRKDLLEDLEWRGGLALDPQPELAGVGEVVNYLSHCITPPERDIPANAAAVLLSLTWQRDLMDYLVARQGLAFAVRAAAQALHCSERSERSAMTVSRFTVWLPPEHPQRTDRACFSSASWFALWAHVAAASGEEYTAARDTAAAARAGAGIISRVHLATLFPREHGWADEDAREWADLEPVSLQYLGKGKEQLVPAQRQYRVGWLLWTAVRDEGLLDVFGRRLEEAAGQKEELRDISAIVGDWPLFILDNLGPGATGSLSMMAQHLHLARQRKLAAEGLSMIRTDDAAEAMVALLDHQDAGPLVRVGLGGMPEPAIQVLTRAAEGQASAQALLDTLSRQHPEIAGGEGAVPAQTACDPADLPEVLATSPWTREAGGEQRVVDGLEVLADEERVLWSDDEDSGREGYIYDEPPRTDREDGDWRETIAREIDEHGQSPLCHLDKLSQAGALQVFNSAPGKTWLWDDDEVLELVARFGRDGIPGFVALTRSNPTRGYPVLARFSSPRVALAMAEGLGRRAGRGVAARWLIKYAKQAAAGLVPLAVGAPGAERELAGQTLRLLAYHGHGEVIRTVAGRYGDVACEALEQVLAADPAGAGPPDAPNLPPWWSADALPAPELDAGGVLPAEAVFALAGLLACSDDELPHPGLDSVRAACTVASLERFAWAQCELWLDAGGRAKGDWALMALAHLGAGETVARLAALVGRWPGERAHGRAVTGLRVLRLLGSDEALQAILDLAERSRYRGLREEARKCLGEMAAGRGVSRGKLTEGLVSDLGLDADGERVFQIRGEAYRASLDGALKPFVRDGRGQACANPPSSDPAWGAFKKEARAAAAMAAARLERAMTGRRRWSVAAFDERILGHPLHRLLARRLIWGVWTDGDQPSLTFVVGDDGSLAGPGGASVDVADPGRVGIPHPLDIGPQLEAWRALGLEQPFPQLDRDVYTPTPEEERSEELTRLGEEPVSGKRVLGLLRKGRWREKRGEGEIAVDLGGGREAAAIVHVAIHALHEHDTPIYPVRIWSRDARHCLGELHPVEFSELVRDLMYLRGS